MPSPPTQRLLTNLAALRERVTAAAARAGRDPEGVRILVVTKGRPQALVRLLVEAGAREVGENRVQEAEAKYVGELRERVRLEGIGHVQTNKARRAARLFDRVQSVDSLKVARALAAGVAPGGAPLPVLLQVNASGEASKYGVSPAEVPFLLEQAASCPELQVEGLMTMAPMGDPRAARLTFRRVARLAEELAGAGAEGARLGELSMGMSDDFEIAVEEGATLVRLGSAVFDGVELGTEGVGNRLQQAPQV